MNPFVRDLAWVMQSPSLIASIDSASNLAGRIKLVTDDYCAMIFDKHLGWLQQLDRNPQPLMDFLSRRKASKLGYYFEDLVAFWLSQKIASDFYESHIKISSGNRDIGELDFLFRAEQEVHHWEAAVKFYLYTQNQQGTVTWYGPDTRDTFSRKLGRMLEHQLRLSDRPEVREILLSRGINDVSPRMFIKGYLFYPFQMRIQNTKHLVAGCEISTSHLAGWWLTTDRLNVEQLNSCSPKSLRWRVLPRLEWLAPRIYSVQNTEQMLHTSSQIVETVNGQISHSGNPRLIAGFSLNEAGKWQEETRGFVVNMGWPDSAVERAH